MLSLSRLGKLMNEQSQDKLILVSEEGEVFVLGRLDSSGDKCCCDNVASSNLTEQHADFAQNRASEKNLNGFGDMNSAESVFDDGNVPPVDSFLEDAGDNAYPELSGGESVSGDGVDSGDSLFPEPPPATHVYDILKERVPEFGIPDDDDEKEPLDYKSLNSDHENQVTYETVSGEESGIKR